jgi:hypothetical protein
MLELDAIASQVEVTASSIQERIARIHDALHALHDLTIALYDATPRDGVLIAHDTLDTLVTPQAGEVYRMPISDLGGGFGELDLDSLRNTGITRLTDDKGVLRYAIARPIPALDWLLVATIPAQGVLQRMERSFPQAFDCARAGNLEHRVDNPGADDIQHHVDGYNEMVAAVQSTLEGKKQTLRELELSRDRARAIFEASPVGLGAVRADRSRDA